MTTQAFFDEFHATYLVNPFNHAEHIIDKACVALGQSVHHPDEVYLEFIKSLEQGCGEASKALQKVCDLADSHQVFIRLFVHPIRSAAFERKLTLNHEKLTAWYKRNGFVNESRGYMVRRPLTL